MGVRHTTVLNNFSRGKVDHDLMARFDLPIYSTGLDKCENFITNFKGNAGYRPGFERMVDFQNCEMREFRFSDEQNYILLFTDLELRFLSYDGSGNFGFVGAPLVVTTPYTLDEARELQVAQNADVMYIVHPNHAPRKLTRVSAASFTLATFARTADPFTGAGDYPSCVTFYKARLYYGNTDNELTTIWGSKAGSYDDMTVGTADDDGLKFTLAEITEEIQWLYKGDNSLVAGSREGLVTINGGGVNVPITPSTVTASLSSAEGCESTYPVKKDGLVFYVGKNSRNMQYFSYDLLSETFKAEDANFISYDITKGGIHKLRFKKDRDDLIYTVRADGSLLTLNFDQGEKIAGWHEHSGQGTFEDIASITDNNGEPQLFVLAQYNGSYYIERLAEFVEFSRRVDFLTATQGMTDAEKLTAKNSDQDAYSRVVAEELKQCIYLDNSECFNNLQDNLITYDDGAGTITATSPVFASGDVGKFIVYKTVTGYEYGRLEITGFTSTTVVDVEEIITPSDTTSQEWYLTFTQLTGLTRFNGQTVSVVSDGGYENDYVVSGGTIDLNQATTSVCVGYKYSGTIKTFSLGFQIQLENTQITEKAVYEIYLRTGGTAGGLVGTSLYAMSKVQRWKSGELINYLPPLPIDGTIQVDVTDISEQDKYIYIVQDKPLPMNVAALMLNVNYAYTKG